MLGTAREEGAWRPVHLPDRRASGLVGAISLSLSLGEGQAGQVKQTSQVERLGLCPGPWRGIRLLMDPGVSEGP